MNQLYIYGIDTLLLSYNIFCIMLSTIDRCEYDGHVRVIEKE